MEKFYITTTLPYVNANPHIGFATELIRADAIARYQEILDKDVFLNTGTDEHGQKIYDNAVATGIDPQSYVDGFATEFKKLIPVLGILPDVHFIRTTDEHHKYAAQEMWRRCEANGDIYKAQHEVKYCTGCELEKTDSELVDGKCSLHPTYEIELRNEENYFFRFSKYQEPLLKFYKENPQFVVPDFRMNEITKFVEGGLQDFSISRLKSKMSWGVPVPDDADHVMYVWFDALTNYLSTTGWPEKEDFDGWWPGMQLAGKDNLRQQCAIWPAMLMSAQLPTPTQVVVGGFITSGGQKMSKSIGNVISPFELVEKYGTDATRYLLLRHVHPFEDTDITWERLDEWYTANLVNGLGNFVSRVMKMAEQYLDPTTIDPGLGTNYSFINAQKPFVTKIDSFRFSDALDYIWDEISFGDDQIQKNQPFKLIKSDPDKAKQDIADLVARTWRIATLLRPFMPETSKTILNAIHENKKPDNLFPRLP
jgi:methionyl-tRNA synthetase